MHRGSNFVSVSNFMGYERVEKFVTVTFSNYYENNDKLRVRQNSSFGQNTDKRCYPLSFFAPGPFIQQRRATTRSWIQYFDNNLMHNEISSCLVIQK